MHDVVIYANSAKGEGLADWAEDGSVLFARGMKINGERVLHPPEHPDLLYPHKELEFRLVGSAQGFLELWIDEAPQALREKLTADDWLEGTDENVLGLPLRSFSIVEADVFWNPAPAPEPFVGEGIGESA